MKKFLVVSGFLGAGKTTSMIRLYHELNENLGVKTGLIANDLGEKDLVDTMFSRVCGCRTEELSGECICYQTENLADCLRGYFDREQYVFVMSDIPGCGVGALDHVYHRLTEDYPGEFQLAPFTVVTDSRRLRAIMPEAADCGLPEEMNYLFRAQLKEADVVALNKTDLLSEAEQERIMDFLRQTCPEAEIFPVCARNGAGIPELAGYLLEHTASLRQPDTGYGGAEFLAAESRLSWYDRQYYVKVCCDTFDGNAYLRDLAEGIRCRLEKAGRNIPHLKLFAGTPEEDWAKLSVLGTEEPLETDRSFAGPVTDMPVILNARAACEAERFAAIVDEAMEETGRKYQLETMVFCTKSFGVTEDDR